MDINATLLGQMITFTIFVWFTMKFVWPLLEQAIQEREEKIASGLAAAEKGRTELAKVEEEVAQHLAAARQQAVGIIATAEKQGQVLLEQARAEADALRQKILADGQQQLQIERVQTKVELEQETIKIAIASAEKFLQRRLNEPDQHKLFADLIKEVDR